MTVEHLCAALGENPSLALQAIPVRSPPSSASDLAAANRPKLVFPGSFNPLHAGHRGMADAAERRMGCEVHFELSIHNVDKPPLTPDEVTRRLTQFPPHQSVWLTACPQFADKAMLFPGATFVVGVDTAQRLADLRYHGGDEAARARQFARIAAQGCRFLVFGRAIHNVFMSLSDVALPAQLQTLCSEAPECEFREDVSSTELRIADQRRQQ